MHLEHAYPIVTTMAESRPEEAVVASRYNFRVLTTGQEFVSVSDYPTCMVRGPLRSRMWRRGLLYVFILKVAHEAHPPADQRAARGSRVTPTTGAGDDAATRLDVFVTNVILKGPQLWLQPPWSALWKGRDAHAVPHCRGPTRNRSRNSVFWWARKRAGVDLPGSLFHSLWRKTVTDRNVVH